MILENHKLSLLHKWVSPKQLKKQKLLSLKLLNLPRGYDFA